jgi:taurine dioxygenase
LRAPARGEYTSGMIGTHRQVRMSGEFEFDRPLPSTTFGDRIDWVSQSAALALIVAAEREPDALPRALAESDGLFLPQGMHAIAVEPDLLVRFSRRFGVEVEDYGQALTPRSMVHATMPEIVIVSNTPLANRPPPRLPEPPPTH